MKHILRVKINLPADFRQPCARRLPNRQTSDTGRALGPSRPRKAWFTLAAVLPLALGFLLQVNPVANAGVFCNPGPSDASVFEGQVATFTVTPGGGTPPYSFRWEKNGTEISGQTAASHTTPPVTTADSGAVFTVFVSDALSTNSCFATLAVLPNPIVQKVETRNDPKHLYVTWNKEVLLNGQYLLSSGIAVYGLAYGGSSNAVVLDTDPIPPDSSLDLVIAGVTDPAGNPVSPPVGVTRFTQGPGRFCDDFSGGLPAGTVSRGQVPPYVGSDGALHLTDAATHQSNYWFIPLPAQATFLSFKARWRTLIGRTPDSIDGINAGDGFSFNAGLNLGLEFQPEEGAANGLSATVDTWNNSLGTPDEPEVGLEIRWHGQRVAFLRSGDGGNNSAAKAPLRKNQFVDSSVEVTPYGLVTFVFDTFTLTAQLPDFSGLVADQCVFAARTGNVGFDNHWIDDVCINDYTLGPVTIAMDDSGGNAMLGQRARPLTLRPTVSGSPPHFFQWLRNGVPIQGANQATYTTPPLVCPDDHGAIYTVTVSNLFSSASDARVLQLEGPAITQQPQDQSVALGSSVTFQVAATGVAPLSYQWLGSSLPLPDETNDTLHIPSAQFSDIGFYSVVVMDRCSISESQPAALVVQNGCVDYEDLTPVGQLWHFGDAWLSGGVPHKVGEFRFRTSQSTTMGTVEVAPGPFGQELFTDSATVFLEPPQLVAALSLFFREDKEGVHLKVNGLELTADHLADLDDRFLDSVFVSVTADPIVTGGGRLHLVGPMAQVGIGGEGLALDEVCLGLAPPEPPACIDFEDLPPPPQDYAVGDGFVASNVKVTVEPFEWVPGTPITTGHVEVETGAHASGSGQELFASQVNLGFELGQDWSIVTLRYEEAFGPFNLRVGPELRWVAQTLTELDQQVVGGVHVTVVPGAQPLQGVMTLRGPVRSFAIGGVELYLDRVCPFEELEITCPSDIVDLPDPGKCEKANVTFTVTAVGNCPGISVACSPPNGATFPVGTTTVNCTATDACGKSNQCSFNVIIVETQPPVFTFRPPDVTVECGQPTDPAHTGGPATATDNCDPNPAITYTDGEPEEVFIPDANGWQFDTFLFSGTGWPISEASLETLEGPAQPPLGSGSLRARASPGQEPWSGALALCNNSFYHNLLLCQVTELRLATFVENTLDSFELILRLDTNSDGVPDNQISFSPELQQGSPSWPDPGPVVVDTWQSWNALVGGWSSFLGFSTLGDYLRSFPDAAIVNTTDGIGGVSWEVGMLAGLQTSQHAYLDFMIIGTNGVSTVYNFE